MLQKGKEHEQDFYNDSYFCFTLCLGSTSFNQKKRNKRIGCLFYSRSHWVCIKHSVDNKILYLVEVKNNC